MSMSKKFLKKDYKETSSEKWIISDTEERVIAKFKGSMYLRLVYERKENATYVLIANYAIEKWDGDCVKDAQAIPDSAYMDIVIKGILGMAFMNTRQALSNLKEYENE